MSDQNNDTISETQNNWMSWMIWVGIIIAIIGVVLIILKFILAKKWMMWVGIVCIVIGIILIIWDFFTEEYINYDNTSETFTEEIVVPTDISSCNNYSGNVSSLNNNYSGNLNNTTVDGTIQNLNETLPDRGTVDYVDNYTPNPDLYPENGQEFLPENSMYTHLENNFLDIGPQIGVATRVNSQRNGPTILFRKQFNVPTVPTGYWNQSTISQPIFTNNVC